MSSEVVKAADFTEEFDFSEELLIEIMKRLPVKYILRCRSVQKSWLRFPEEMDDGFRHMSGGNVVSVYDTCNGLICLSYNRMQEKVFLWNPALRVFNVLPDSPIPDPVPVRIIRPDSTSQKKNKKNKKIIPRDYLIPPHDPTTLGLAFGYLAKTNDYKIIKYEECSFEVSVYVYTLSTDSWKTVKKLGRCPCYKLSNSVFVNGVAYWVASMDNSRESEKAIVCFDMEKDTIREILLPPPYSKNNVGSDVLVQKSNFGELLSLFYFDRSTYILHIWVLENAGEPNEAWTKKKSLNFKPTWWPMGFRNNSEIVLKDCRNFLSYDYEKNEAGDIFYDDSMYPFCQDVNRFEETLVLLDVNRQA
ncbi:hypothetical protein POM88_032920 [Heracleum sosnowskyi]|uniref:F-box associated beta-propeller type 1 domain-containing protein n=1 Tax=Heracleum sosnowskyi TaxID=360622 RepID=A0AAD8ML34_9APIA|nr:hypothetical protein POM88_032920 [Heracleum sosnowskyi]